MAFYMLISFHLLAKSDEEVTGSDAHMALDNGSFEQLIQRPKCQFIIGYRPVQR